MYLETTWAPTDISRSDPRAVVPEYQGTALEDGAAKWRDRPSHPPTHEKPVARRRGRPQLLYDRSVRSRTRGEAKPEGFISRWQVNEFLKAAAVPITDKQATTSHTILKSAGEAKSLGVRLFLPVLPPPPTPLRSLRGAPPEAGSGRLQHLEEPLGRRSRRLPFPAEHCGDCRQALGFAHTLSPLGAGL